MSQQRMMHSNRKSFAKAAAVAMPAKPRVHKITFHLLSPEEIERNIAVMEVTKKELYDNGNALITNASIAASVVTSDYFEGGSSGASSNASAGGRKGTSSSSGAAAAAENTTRILESDAVLVKGTSAAPSAPKLSATLMAITKSTNVKNRIEAEGGLLDYRLGSTDRKTPCKTCGLTGGRTGCPGHFGYIKLNFPVFFVGTLNVCKNTLKLVCHFCSRLLIDPTTVLASLPAGKETWDAMSFEDRFELLVSLRKPNATCLHRCLVDGKNSECDNIMAAMPQPLYTVDKLRVVPVWKSTAAYCAKYLASGVPSEAVSNALDLLAEHMARPFVASDAWTILNQMHPDDMSFVGYQVDPQSMCDHPRNMILSSILVLPKHLRPTSSFDKGRMRSQNDKTKKYQDILDANEAVAQDLVKETAGDYSRVLPQTACTLPMSVLQKLYASSIANLEWQVATLFNNDIKGVKVDRQRSGKPFKSLYQGFKGGKAGRWRQNTVSKRSNFTSRHVVSSDRDLSVDECGVPLAQFLTLTAQERVTQANIDELQKAVHRGPGVIGGASHVKLLDGTTEIDLAHCVDRTAVRLSVGMEVSRCLRTNEIGVINRQPTLYKMSMQAIRLKPVNGNTFRVNMSITPPFNMDFDGDELNMHIPQGVEEQVEAKRLMNVQGNLMSTQSCKMTMYLVQDALVAAWRISQRSTLLTKPQAVTLLGQLKYFRHQAIAKLLAMPPAVLFPQRLYSGKQVYSAALFPKSLYYDRWRESAPAAAADKGSSSPVSDTYDDHVVIRAGRLLSGRLCKRTLGPSHSSAVYAMAREDAAYVTKFLSEAQRIGNYFFIAFDNFSIGPADLVMPQECRQTIRQIVSLALQQDAAIIASTKMLADKRHVEPARQKVLKRLLPRCAEIASSYLQHTGNGCKDVIDCGSKGSAVNIGQMTSCVGQQTVEGTRITSGGRLPCFPVDACDAVSQGLIKHSLLHGLNPHEFFHHAQAGREGLVDTAVKTSDTGYFQRRIARNTENACLENDKSVYNWNGRRMQHVYGGDGWSVNKIVKTSLLYLCSGSGSGSGQDIEGNVRTDFMFDSYEDYLNRVPLAPRSRRARAYYEKSVVPILEQQAAFVTNEALYFSHVRRNTSHKLCSEPVSEFYAPSDLAGDLEHVLRTYDGSASGSASGATANAAAATPPLDAKSCYSFLELLYKHIQRIDAHKANRTRDYYFASSLPIKRLLSIGVTAEQMDRFCRLVLARFKDAQCPPGLSVGMVAAESIGEPTTQLTLNTFHLAGVETTKMVTSGLVRMEELIALQKIIKVTYMTIAFNPNSAEVHDAAAAARFAASICMLSVEDVVAYRKIVYNPVHLLASAAYNAEDELLNGTSSSSHQQQRHLSDTLSDEDADAMRYFTQEQLPVFVQEYDHARALVNATSDFVILLRLDHRKLINARKSPADVAHALRNKLDVTCSSLPLQTSACLCDPCVVLATPTNIQFGALRHWYIYLRIPGVAAACKTLPEQRNLSFLKARSLTESTVFNGIKNITAAFVRQEPSCNEYVVDTYGSNLVEILAEDCVDTQRTTTNNLYEIESVFGIEAAAEALFYEYKQTMSASNSSINDRHFSLLVDVQCIDGRMKALTRYGINQDHAPLTQIAFEKSVENMYKAAVYQKTDNVADVTSNVMMGQNIPVGTGKVGFALLDPYMPVATQEDGDCSSSDKNGFDAAPSESELLSVVSSKLPSNNSSSNSSSSGVGSGELWWAIPNNMKNRTFGDHFYPLTPETLKQVETLAAAAAASTAGLDPQQRKVRDAVLSTVLIAYGGVNSPASRSSQMMTVLPCAMPVDLTRDILKNLNPRVSYSSSSSDDVNDENRSGGGDERCAEEQYSVREKTDGSRYLLVLCQVDSQPYACLVNRRCDVFFVSVCAPRILFHLGSVYDTELVRSSDATPPTQQQQQHTLLVMDVIQHAGVSYREKTWRQRYEAIHQIFNYDVSLVVSATMQYNTDGLKSYLSERALRNPSNYHMAVPAFCTPADAASRACLHPVFISAKSCYIFSSLHSLIESTKCLTKTQFPCDGLIIQNITSPVNKYLDKTIFKWKPAAKRTIDVVLLPVSRPTGDKQLDDETDKKKKEQCVADCRYVPHVRSPDNTLVPLYENHCRVEAMHEQHQQQQLALLAGNNDIITPDADAAASVVYECNVRFEKKWSDANQGGGEGEVDEMIVLQVLRARDKAHPNTTTSAESVLQCIREDVTLDEMLAQSLVGMHELTRERLIVPCYRGTASSAIVYKTDNNSHEVIRTKIAYHPSSPPIAYSHPISNIARHEKNIRQDIITRLERNVNKVKPSYRPSSPKTLDRSIPPPDVVSISPDFMCVDIDQHCCVSQLYK